MSFVCGTDFGKNASVAAEIAARLAAKAGEPLVLVHALEVPALGFVAGDPLFLPTRNLAGEAAALRDAVDTRLASEAARLAKLTGANVVPRLTIAAPDSAILEAAAETKPAFVVTGTHGRMAPARWILGSTADRLARRSHDPVLVVREPCEGLEAWTRGQTTLRVLLGVAFDESFDEAARAAKALTAWGPCELHFAFSRVEMSALYSGFTLHSPLTPADAHAPAARAIENLAKGRGLVVEKDRVHLLDGTPAHALVEAAKRGSFDLIVLGTHGRRGLERALLGSVALGVLHHSPCPVLIAPVV